MKMNKLFFFFFSILAFTSCASEYKIEGSSSVSRLDGKMLFVKVPMGESMVNIDSSEVIHGMFKMEGVADSSIFASLYMDDESIMPFVIEKKNSIDDMAYELSRLESRMIMDGSDPEDISRELSIRQEKLVHDMDKLTKEFIQSNYNNILGPAVNMNMEKLRNER